MRKLPMKPGVFTALCWALLAISALPSAQGWGDPAHLAVIVGFAAIALQFHWTLQAMKYSEQLTPGTPTRRSTRAKYALEILALVAVVMLLNGWFSARAIDDLPFEPVIAIAAFGSVGYFFWQAGAALNEAESRPNIGRAIGTSFLFFCCAIGGSWFLFGRLKRLTG